MIDEVLVSVDEKTLTFNLFSIKECSDEDLLLTNTVGLLIINNNKTTICKAP